MSEYVSDVKVKPVTNKHRKEVDMVCDVVRLARLARLTNDLLEMFDYTEESDSGTVFHPTHISSCRIMHCERINKILPEMKKLLSEIKVETDDDISDT